MQIGLDIGGYKINSVLMTGKRIIKKRKILIKSMSNRKIMIAQIFDCIDFLINGVNKEQIKGIGIGVAGPIDLKKGIVLNPPNLKALENFPLTDAVWKRFKIKTIINNDVNCLGIAEGILGAGKNKENIVGLTLGTGVGGCLILKRKLFCGASGSAGEIGHMIIKKDGRKCNCGNKGCLETYVSTKGIIKTAREVGLRGRTPEQIVKMAKRGNKKAIKVFQITGEYLGIGLSNVVNILNPNLIIVGGGIANAGKFIFDSAKKSMKKNILSPLAKNTKIVKAKLGEDAGAIGAALLSYPQVSIDKCF